MPSRAAMAAILVLVMPLAAGCAPIARGPSAEVPASAAAASLGPSSVTPSPAPSVIALQTPGRADRSLTQARVEFLTDRVRADPNDGDAQLELGLALLQRIRETADPTLYGPAETALTAARRLLPRDPGPLIGLGGLQLGRHQFAAALKTGRAASRLDPGSVSAGGIEVDALVELGQYDDAFMAAQRLAARSPDLTSLARLSYTRELRGDIDGALDAMRQAVRSPSLAPENTAFALSIVGHLERLAGDPAAAREAYQHALTLVPEHPASLAGLGRLAVGDGDLDAAASYFERAAAVVPLPEYVIALGETKAAAGDTEAADRQFDLARAEITLFKANGVAVDLDLALFEADHGDPGRALDYAQAAYRSTPTIRAADAVAWSLLRLGRDDDAAPLSREALRLGSHDPLFLYHAGVIDAGIGDRAGARDHLTAALAADPGFSAVGAKDARTLLAGLDASS